ncbi:MAG: amidohydrolase [Candidatus Rokubacteria bacterium]|nr:amidohydrolase [Candidatus Rokubacteria bacterium]
MLLTGGRIYTLDARNTVCDALVVRDGLVAFAGRRADVNLPAGEPVLDLAGRAVVPGLVDAHAHLAILARSRLSLNVGPATSEDDAARIVGEAARQARADDWLSGRGWDETRWPGARRPTKASLDRVAPRSPVALVRVDGHATWANSAALAAAGITRTTRDPSGGIVVKGADGAPTGLLIDAAQELVRTIEPPPSEARFDRAVRDAIGECLRKGLTGVHEMGADLHALASYRRLVERGEFAMRNWVAVSGRKAWAEQRERGPETLGDGRLVIGALKLWFDGALGSRGAALHAPYCDDPGNTGLVLVPPDEVERLTADARARGFSVCVHAIGDRANTLVLDAFERALAREPDPDHRLRVEHAQVLTPGDLPRFARLGIIPSMQPAHCVSDMRWAEDRLGPGRVGGAYAWRSILATGTIIAGGSDFPVEDANPFHGFHAAVTRRPLDGAHPGWSPEQRMTREEAARAFTTWNAYAARQERELGSLEPGKRADLVVLSDDVFTCPEDRIKDVTPVRTMVDGRLEFSRDPA